MKKPAVPVSDHAVIRYLERVLKIDVDRHRVEIGRMVERGMEMGACGVILGGFEYRIQEGVVTTVLIASRPDIRTGKVRKERDE